METTSLIPKVSVVMPIYNQSAYVKGALTSLIRQTYKNWELIVIKDGENPEERLKRRLDRRVCRNCRIFPLCGGGCVQTAQEAPASRCVKNMSDDRKDKIVLSRFYRYVVARQQLSQNKGSEL